MCMSCNSKTLKQKSSCRLLLPLKPKISIFKDGLKINGDHGGTVVKLLCYK